MKTLKKLLLFVVASALLAGCTQLHDRQSAYLVVSNGSKILI